MRILCILAAALAVPACESESSNSLESTKAPTAEIGQPTEQKPPIGKDVPNRDVVQILGTWKSVRYEKDGRVDPLGSGGKAVFEDNDAVIHSLPFFSYELDPQQTPKHFTSTATKAIYRLQGDSLTICMTTSSDEPRPTEFATQKGDGRVLMVFKRASPLDPDAPDAVYDRELRAKIQEGIELLERGKLREFGEWMGRPIPDEELANGLDTEAKQRMNQLLATLRVMLKVEPKLNWARTKATFDLSGIHIEGGIGHTWWFNFAKKDGQWYVVKDRVPLVE
jgi:uncharacterized protein (TIGR03067 family)